MKKIYASFKHGKIFSKVVDTIILAFDVLLLGIIIWLAMGLIKRRLDLYVLYGLIFLVFVEVVFLWLVIRDITLKKRIKIWMQDAVEVHAFVELINKPSIFGQMAELRAEIFWKETNKKKRKLVLRAVLQTALYKKILNKKTNAFYSEKYQQLIFFKE